MSWPLLSRSRLLLPTVARPQDHSCTSVLTQHQPPHLYIPPYFVLVSLYVPSTDYNKRLNPNHATSPLFVLRHWHYLQKLFPVVCVKVHQHLHSSIELSILWSSHIMTTQQANNVLWHHVLQMLTHMSRDCYLWALEICFHKHSWNLWQTLHFNAKNSNLCAG